MNNIIYGGKSLLELGFAVKGFPIHHVAARDMEFSPVLGRSGDVIRDNQRYLNVETEYEINTVYHDILQNKSLLERRLADWLLSGAGEYRRFEDTTVPGCYTKAICTGIGEIATNHLDGFLSTVISFNRVPFWYTYEGERERVLEYTDNDHILSSYVSIILENPENYSALPYIKIKGEGHFKLRVNTSEVLIYLPSTENHTNYIELDSETQQATMGDTSMSSYISADYMPILTTGQNVIRLEGQQGYAPYLENITVIPRWRRL